MMNLWQVNIGVLWIISSEKCLQNSQENIYRSPIFSKGVFPVNFIKHLLQSTSQSLLLKQFCLFRLFEEPFYLFLSCARQRVVSVLPEVHMMFKCKSSNKHYGIRQVLATSKGIVKTSKNFQNTDYVQNMWQVASGLTDSFTLISPISQDSKVNKAKM